MKKHPPKSRQRILQSYQRNLREVVGLSPKTCENHSRDISSFLEAVPIRRTADLADLTPADLTDYLTVRSADYQPASLRQVACSLRHFLRFAQQQGWTNSSLSLAVPKIACRAHHDLPAYLSQQQLELLLASWDSGTAEGRRDLAISLCLSRLGLRAGELAALSLEDLNWRQGILHLNQSKNGSPAQLPLLSEVGEAISNYLRAGRPACSYRQVFLLHQPARPMDRKAISRVIRRGLRRCGIEVPHPGAHVLRHTLASHLVQNGASLKEVADLLRHRHLNSAAVYAHVDVPPFASSGSTLAEGSNAVKMDLHQAVDLYLETRRSFGFALVQVGVELRSFVRYAQQMGHRGPLTTSLAVQWTQQPQQCQRSYWALRLDIVRRFAQFLLAYEPCTEIPPGGWFGPTYRRRAVHVYTRQEVGALLEAASDLGHVHPLRGWTFCAVVGLLDCTGLRIGEALSLSDQDIDWSAGVLTIGHAKGGHARLVPVQPSTLEALQRYRTLRDKAIGPSVAPRLFVTFGGLPLGYFGVSAAFRKLCQCLGRTQPPVPRLHDLRHTFAVRTLLEWCRSAEPVGPKLWTLSTYLGHRHLAETYWYLTAVPELMQLCQGRFATAQAWASGGMDHD